MPTTPGGLPYPLGTDPVANGAQDIQDLAEAVDAFPGLRLIKTVTIGITVPSVPVTDAFSATYNNYLITVNGGVSSVSADNLGLQMGSTVTGYRNTINGVNTASGWTGAYDNNTNQRWIWAGAINVQGVHARIELSNPFLALNTFMQSQMLRTGANGHWTAFGTLENTISYTGFTIQPASGTLTGGFIRVYGYRN